MKMYKRIIVFLFTLIPLLSCNTSTKSTKEQITGNISGNTPVSVNIPLLLGEDYDYFTDYYWSVSDGRYIEDVSVSAYRWMGDMTPRVVFRKLEIPAGSIMYQERLRREYFTLFYQTEDKTKLYKLEDSSAGRVFDIMINTEMDPGNTHLILSFDGYLYSGQVKTGGESNINYPLTGIWGRLPNLTEYRQVDYSECLYYMVIEREIPYWAVREGSYLLKQTGENTFETVTSFPDGSLRLEVRSDRQIVLRPLFTLPRDETGLTGLLVLNRNSIKISEISYDD